MAGEKILIIEDDHDVALMLDEMMRERGYRTVIAHDGRSGLDLALQERPDLTLLDLRLPRMSGAQLLSKLHEHQLNIPVVVVTGWGSEELALHALRMGVKDYVKKPFDLTELWEVIERTLTDGRLRRENARLYQYLRESRDQVAKRSADLKGILSKLIRLQRIALALGKLTIGADLREVYTRLTEYAALLMEVRSSAVLLFDPQCQALVCQESAFGLDAQLVQNYRIPLSPVSPIWSAWGKGQSLVVNDLTESPIVQAMGLDELVAQTGMRSTMFSALRLGGRSIGLFQVADKLNSSAFTTDDQRVLEIFASQSAIAIENARLFTNEKRRASEMKILLEIAQAVTERVTERPQASLERIARGACEVLQADGAVVFPFVAGDPDTYDVANVAAFGTLHTVELSDKVLPDDPVRLVRQQNPLICEDITRDQPDLLAQPFFKRESVRAFAGALLEADEEELGVLYVLFRAFHSFEEQELTSVRLVAHQAALSISKSRLFGTLNQDYLQTNADLRRKLGEMEELQKISKMISSMQAIELIFDGILQSAMSITGAPNANVLMMDEESGTITSRWRQGDQYLTEKMKPLELEPNLAVAAEERPATAQDNADLAADETLWLTIFRRLVPDADTGSFLYVPIMSGGERRQVGLLGISSPQHGQFGSADLRLLKALADQAAIAVQNTRYLQTVRIYQEQQVAAERIAAIADVAGNMVHRINNAVGAIRPLLQQIEMKLDQGQLDEVYLQDRLQRIRRNAEHTLEVARQIGRPFQWVALEAIDVNESIAAAWAELKTPVGVEVKIEYSKNLPPVKATRQLDEVFRNLMKNALDAMAKDGGVLSVRNRRLSERQIEVIVQDTGPGIPPEIQDKIFHMGTTTKPGGTGFGLWWSRTFLRRLGGDMVFESKNGKGCEFKVILPICEE